MRFVLAQARAGNREAFRTLVERHSRAVFRVAYRITGNEADAEDVVQETFSRAYTELARFEARSGFGTWVHRIAANCAIDLIRRRPKHVVDRRGQRGRAAAGAPGEPGARARARGGGATDAGPDRRRDAGVDAARTRGLHAAAPGAAVDRGDQRALGQNAGGDPAQHLPRGREDAARAGAAGEDRAMTHLAEEQLDRVRRSTTPSEHARADRRRARRAVRDVPRRDRRAARDARGRGAIQPVPERGDDYGAAVWARLEPRLDTSRARRVGAPDGLARVARGRGGRCVAVVGAFLAGRLSRETAASRQQAVTHVPPRPTVARSATASSWPHSATTSIAPSATLVELVNADADGTRGHLGRAVVGPRPARRQPALSPVRARRELAGARRRCSTSSSRCCSTSSTAQRRCRPTNSRRCEPASRIAASCSSCGSLAPTCARASRP